jgi:hypothetical protein
LPGEDLIGLRHCFTFLLVFVGVSVAVPLWAQEKKNKIEELFIWKISDELKLSPKEEKSFSDLFTELSKKKSEITHEQDDLLNKLAAAATDKERSHLLAEYRKQVLDANKIQLREFDELKKILGPERLGKYFHVKRDLTNKVKSLLTEKGEKKESDLPPPKVIEE